MAAPVDTSGDDIRSSGERAPSQRQESCAEQSSATEPEHETGKTEVGSVLANKLGWRFYDADDYHPIENKMKMSQGIPLSDEDRQPWLSALHELIKREKACGQRVVLACSALKEAYRRSLTTGGDSPEKRCQHKEDDISSETLFIHLQGSIELISKRMQKRKGHFMPLKLLESQFDTLEPPAAPELFITVNVEKDIPEIVSELQAMLQDETQI